MNGFGSINEPNTPITWSAFVAEAGSFDIGFISLDLDGGYPTAQTMLVDNFAVNGQVVSNQAATAPEPGALLILSIFAGIIGLAYRRYSRSALAD